MNDLSKAVSIFKLLGDDTRMKILVSLMEESKTVNNIVSDINLTQSCVSHQLKLLKEEHIVKSERKGKCIIYSLDDEHIRVLLSQTLEHTLEDR